MQEKERERSFEKLVSEHEGLLRKVCRLYAAAEADRQDLFQEIIIQLWRAYPSFRGEAKLSTWLYRVALNTAISGLRKQKGFVSFLAPETLPETFASDTILNVEEERLQEMYNAISQLNAVEKAVVMLYLDDRSYEEMEEVLGTSSATLRVKMSRIKEKLRQLTKPMSHGTR